MFELVSERKRKGEAGFTENDVLDSACGIMMN
jgi:hypothetical protein